MTRIARGKNITFTFKEKGPGGKATLVIDVSAEDDILPHEHRDDMREVAAELLAVPVAALEGVDVELKRTGGDHEHPHPHPHPAPISLPSDQSGGDKTKA
jgi:hypothetical protein